MSSESRSFDPDQLRAVRSAVGSAEDLTGRYYCIPGHEWPRYPYEVGTRADGSVPAHCVFADVVRLVADRSRPGFGERFRIRLRDDTILAAIEERDDGVELSALLLYVLTHELVHVVRFSWGCVAFDAAPDVRAAEEIRVHAITRGVLSPIADASLCRVVQLYSEASDDGVGSPK